MAVSIVAAGRSNEIRPEESRGSGVKRCRDGSHIPFSSEDRIK